MEMFKPVSLLVSRALGLEIGQFPVWPRRAGLLGREGLGLCAVGYRACQGKQQRRYNTAEEYPFVHLRGTIKLGQAHGKRRDGWFDKKLAGLGQMDYVRADAYS